MGDMKEGRGKKKEERKERRKTRHNAREEEGRNR